MRMPESGTPEIRQQIRNPGKEERHQLLPRRTGMAEMLPGESLPLRLLGREHLAQPGS
jgi:hypothetical protein